MHANFKEIIFEHDRMSSLIISLREENKVLKEKLNESVKFASHLNDNKDKAQDLLSAFSNDDLKEQLKRRGDLT